MSNEGSELAPVAGAADRAPMVRAMFNRIAPKYDVTNRVLSLGLDQVWRRQAIKSLDWAQEGEVLDLCAGTMDLTCMLVEGGARHVWAVDFSEGMLEAGKAKLPEGAPVTALVGDARDLPLEDNSVDGIIAGFGLRNVPDLHLAIAECARVLRVGGRLVVLDFFRPVSLPSKLLQGTYNRFIVPIVGGVITGFGDAYKYLNTSIDAFLSREEFEQLLAEHGLVPSGKEMFPPVASRVDATKVAPGAVDGNS